MRQMIVGNWKMNGLTADAEALAGAILDDVRARTTPEADIVVCPPYTQIATVARVLAGSRIAWGAQDCHMDDKGAHTGDVAPPMLRDLGCGYVILGHSERRHNHSEIDETVREKCVAALRAGLIPIVCVGENEDQRAAGREQDTVGWQIKGSLPDGFSGIVAYEPVWAIGTGRNAEEADIEAMHRFVRAELISQLGEEAGQATPILYGGSVGPGNAAALLSVPEVGGALVGGASLKAADFLAVIRAAAA